LFSLLLLTLLSRPSPEWILYTALLVFKSALLPFSFKIYLLYLLLESLLPTIYVGRRLVYGGLRGKGLVYKK
jgi:hypothetical protein